MLCDVLNKELAKTEKQNAKKVKKNKEASYKYLKEIYEACDGFRKNVTVDGQIDDFKKMGEKFQKAAKFSDPHKISLLSDINVKTHLNNQATVIITSANNMKKVKKSTR